MPVRIHPVRGESMPKGRKARAYVEDDEIHIEYSLDRAPGVSRRQGYADLVLSEGFTGALDLLGLGPHAVRVYALPLARGERPKAVAITADGDDVTHLWYTQDYGLDPDRRAAYPAIALSETFDGLVEQLREKRRRATQADGDTGG